jgi:hypothetical protein
MKRLFLLLFLAATLPPIVIAQSPTVTAKWTAEQQLILSDMPSPGQAIEMATPANRLDKPAELKDICARMSNDFATWQPSDDGKTILIELNRSTNPDWGKESWQLHLTRMAGVYLMK